MISKVLKDWVYIIRITPAKKSLYIAKV